MKRNFNLFSASLLIISLIVLLFVLQYMGRQNAPEKKNVLPPVTHTQSDRDNPFAAGDFRYEMLSATAETRDQYVNISEYRRSAIEYIKRNGLAVSFDNSGISWTSIGPGNIGGRIRSIMVLSDVELLIGAVAGGLWRTTNGGLNWIPLLDDDTPISISCIHEVLVDSLRTYHYYAGTGEGWGNLDAVYGGGIYKSTDLGITWELLPATTGAAATSFRNVMNMDSDTAGHIYAATRCYDF